MNKQWLWSCCVLTALTLLAGWSLYSVPPSVDAQEGDYKVFLPLIISPGPPALYGVDYPNESDISYLATLNVKFVRMMTPSSPQAALALLDMAESYDLRVVLRVGSGDWGWNGSSFDLSRLADYESVIGSHPALLAFYGLHEPWESFNAEELRLFYKQWQAVAPSLPVWHDMDYLLPEFTDGICDYCSVTAHSHFWDRDGNPVNDYNFRTRPILEMSQANTQADPDAVLCVELQVFGNDFEGQPQQYRMPTADEMRENAAIVIDEFGVTCGTWYAYHHDAYDYVLSDPQFDEQRQVVAETYNLYFAP